MMMGDDDGVRPIRAILMVMTAVICLLLGDCAACPAALRARVRDRAEHRWA